MRILELMAGTGSVGKVAKKLGWEVVSLDISDRFHKGQIDIITDIQDWDYQEQYKEGYFDIIWASPPCASFSCLQYCNLGKGKTYNDLEFKVLKEGLPLLMKCLEIITYFHPTYYFIENPQTGTMKKFLGLPFYDVDYCKYGYDYRKRTRIWTNLKGFEGRKCEKKNPCEGSMNDGKYKHKVNFGRFGDTETNKKNKTKLEERYSIPSELIGDIFRTILIENNHQD
jgi:hypothetical protein